MSDKNQCEHGNTEICELCNHKCFILSRDFDFRCMDGDTMYHSDCAPKVSEEKLKEMKEFSERERILCGGGANGSKDTSSDWREEFDKDFQFEGVIYKGQRHWKDGVKNNLVKSYIQKKIINKVLDHEKQISFKEGSAYLGKNKREMYMQGASAERAKLREIVEKMKKEKCRSCQGMNCAHSYACDALSELLKQME